MFTLSFLGDQLAGTVLSLQLARSQLDLQACPGGSEIVLFHICQSSSSIDQCTGTGTGTATAIGIITTALESSAPPSPSC